MQWIGRFLILFGFVAVALGIVLYMGWGKAAFGWVGHLPGDIRIERENFRFYFPLTTSILLSIVLSIIIRLAMMFRGT
jgi:hypothetical protein